MESVKMGACGLDCGSCKIYRAAFDAEAADSLAKWFRSMGWIGEAEDGADVMAKAPYCMGCHGSRAAHWSDDCFILKCCVDEKRLDHCGMCSAFPCQRLVKWSQTDTSYGAAVDRLKTILKNE